jgi:hypothetical protein
MLALSRTNIASTHVFRQIHIAREDICVASVQNLAFEVRGKGANLTLVVL